MEILPTLKQHSTFSGSRFRRTRATLLLLFLIGCEVSEYQPPTPAPVPVVQGDAVHITQANYESIISQTDQLVLIDFWAPWCEPCVELSPTIESVATRYRGRVIVGKLNIDELPDIAADYGIRAIPAMVIVKNGAEARRIQGGRSEQQIARELEGLMGQ